MVFNREARRNDEDKDKLTRSPWTPRAPPGVMLDRSLFLTCGHENNNLGLWFSNNLLWLIQL